MLEVLHAYGIQAQRNDQTYVGGKGNPDISAQIRGKAYHVEVKRVERLNICAAMQQAINDCDWIHTPIVIHRKNRGEWLVTLRLEDFIGNEVEE